MKNLNKYTNILNIFTIIVLTIAIIIRDIIIIYKNAIIALEITYYIIATINIIVAIINLVKKNTKIGVLQIIAGIIMLAGYLIASNESSIPILAFIEIIAIALSIANLVFNKKLDKSKNKIPLILFIIFVFIELGILAVPITMNTLNMKNLEGALDKLKNCEYARTYVYEADNGNTIILDENANIIAQKDYELFLAGMEIKYEGKIIPLGYGITPDNKLIFVDCKGDILFEIYPSLVKTDKFDQYEVESKFISYVTTREKFGISFVSTNINFNEIKEQDSALYRYQPEDMSNYEENANSEYLYFKNEDLTDIILQIELTNSVAEDKKLSSIYLEEVDLSELVANNSDKNLSYDLYNSIDKFYEYNKNYYLINTSTEEVKKLECENLIYEPYYDEENNLIERILLYSNNGIPYYDSEITGYFDLSGNKYNAEDGYIIQDVTNEAIIMFNKNAGKFHVISVKNQTTQEYTNFKIYNNFYIAYDENLNQYQVLNNELEVLVTSVGEEPEILGNNIFSCMQLDENDIPLYNTYYYNGTNAELVCSSFDNLINFSPIKDSYNYDDSIYSKIGVITSTDYTNVKITY